MIRWVWFRIVGSDMDWVEFWRKIVFVLRVEERESNLVEKVVWIKLWVWGLVWRSRCSDRIVWLE